MACISAIKPLCVAALLVTWILPKCASAGYSYSFNLLTPSQVIAGQQTTIGINESYDTTTPPTGFLYVNGTGSGLLKSEPFSWNCQTTTL